MKNITLLVIDDDPLSRRLLIKILEGSGIGTILTAENGSDGINVLATAEPKVNAVFSDIDMPIMNGWEFVSKIRLGAVEAYKSVPIYMLTSKGTVENEQKSHYKKVNGYALKPPRKDVIAGILDEIASNIN